MENKFNKTRELAENGLRIAVNNANREFPGWQERCWGLFERWIGKKEKGFRFLMEIFRNDCEKFNVIEVPASKRAYGFVSKKAMKEGLIKQIGTAKVSNPKAHNANAALYVKV